MNFNSLESRERLTLSWIFFIVISLLIGDVIDDLSHGSSISHVMIEAGIILFCLVGIITLCFNFFSPKKNRNTSEKTVRQQASAIYQKSNLSSRSELSAFFLEDLLVIPS
jgi:hypothetical protein